MTMSKYKCRPGDSAFHDDPYYVKEMDVSKHWRPGPVAAAEEYAAFVCNRRSEYDEMDVQVLTPEGWVTFEVAVQSVPEFVASRKKGEPPVPNLVRCNECDGRFDVAVMETGCGVNICRKCYADWLEGDDVA